MSYTIMQTFSALAGTVLSKVASLAGFKTGIMTDLKPKHPPLVTFGVCTDLQWADVDDRKVHGSVMRFVSRALWHA